MNPRTKFLLGGVVVLGAAGVLMAGAIKDTGVYFLTPQELHAKVAADPSLIGTGLKVGARVVAGSVVRDEGGRQVTFEMTDGQATYKVDYRGIIPDTFSDSVDVVVEGRLDADGTFHATTLLAKCASRYEAAPEGYAPGTREAYKSAVEGETAAPAAPAVSAAPPEGR
jgi:cytochrome c-type biogenesis protein CcmE